MPSEPVMSPDPYATPERRALRADSPLAAHRQRAHLEMVELLTERLHDQDSTRDPLTYRALIWALEAASLELLGSAAKRADIERAKAVLGDLLIASLCPQASPLA